jgi:hypothetical protein
VISLQGRNTAALPFDDTGQASSAYGAPTRNTTADLTLSGMSISRGISYPLPARVIKGASFYCPNCDPPTNPPVACTSKGVKTGSWVHGLNDQWTCVF